MDMEQQVNTQAGVEPVKEMPQPEQPEVITEQQVMAARARMAELQNILAQKNVDINDPKLYDIDYDEEGLDLEELGEDDGEYGNENTETPIALENIEENEDIDLDDMF